MKPMTYGEHAEDAAQGLNRLLQQDVIPAEPEEVRKLLQCRDAVIDALRQRLYGVGLHTWYPRSRPATPVPGLNLEGIDNKLATLLDHIVLAAPTLPLGERLEPLEVLGKPSLDWVVETWRQTAVDLLSATHVLDTAAEKPWLRDRGAGWYVLRDLAVAMEAVLVLDARLAEVGLLNEHDRPAPAMGLEEARLVASQAARVATWYATSDAADKATSRVMRAAPSTVLHPVALVAEPKDLAAAQERLATFLRAMIAHDAAYTAQPEISADSARQVTASQLFLCRTFAGMAARTRTTRTFVSFFGERAEVLEALQPQLRHLVDVTNQEPDRRRFWQQGEITTALTRMQNRNVDLSLPPAHMLALANATHRATHNLGVCLRRELFRGNSNLRDANPVFEEGPRRVGRRTRLRATLTDLVTMPAPSLPVAKFSSPLQRAALRSTLDVTPTHRRPPSPYPVAGPAGQQPTPSR